MKKGLSLALVLTLLLCLCACGSSSLSTSASTEAAYARAESYSDSGFYAGAVNEADYDNGASGSEDSLPETDPSKIIYTANATVETTDFDASVSGLQEMLASYGGYIQSSSIYGNNYDSLSAGYAGTRSASYTIRIPCESFSTVMNSLSALGNIPYTSTYTENISAQYYDTQARLEAYEAQEDSLLAMMEQAETVSDLITIEDKLSEVRYNIESLQTTLNGWDRAVSYSTIYLDIEEVQTYTPAAKLSFWDRLANAFESGFSSFGDFMTGLVLFLAAALPFLIVLALIVVLIVMLAKHRKKRKAAKAAAAAVTAATETEQKS